MTPALSKSGISSAELLPRSRPGLRKKGRGREKTDPNQVLLRTGHLSLLGRIKSSGPPQSCVVRRQGGISSGGFMSPLAWKLLVGGATLLIPWDACQNSKMKDQDRIQGT